MRRALSTIALAMLFAWPVAASAASQDAPESETAGVNHVGLTVKDLTASTAFFTEALGWRRAGGDADYPANFVTNGDAFVTLWAVQDSANQVDFNRKANVGLHHLAITVTSFTALDALYVRIKDWPGVVIEFAPEPAYGGPAKHMMIREPSGNRLEFVHRPPRGK